MLGALAALFSTPVAKKMVRTIFKLAIVCRARLRGTKNSSVEEEEYEYVPMVRDSDHTSFFIIGGGDEGDIGAGDVADDEISNDAEDSHEHNL